MWRLLLACDSEEAKDAPELLPEEEIEGCDGATLLAASDDPSERGPWPVGARTAEIGRLTVEIWYPAIPGSELGAPEVDYDIRYALPESQRPLIPDDLAPHHPCDCARDLPLDAEHGPYPVVIFVHGAAAWRSQSLSEVTHWASRGFVVLAADHPGLWLADTLALLCPDDPTGPQDLAGDVASMVGALSQPEGDLAFLAGAIDVERLALAGHSAGGSAVASLSGEPHVRVAIPMAAGTPTSNSSDLVSTLFLGAELDAVVPYSAAVSGYEASPAGKRLVGIGNSGHLAFSDICEIRNDLGDDILTIANDVGICGAFAAGVLFDCDPSFLDAAATRRIVSGASAAVLEETLHCRDIGGYFESLSSLDGVYELRESLP